ncbi:MAG: TIGR03085 family protein [Actinobacteria bacterium]|nr:TIGR03085 family protein [Actinomycetota bacterium]
MTSKTWAQSERESLSNLFTEVGPDAPTLCEGWTTRDLAAHLIVRESRPDAALGIVIPALSDWGRRAQDRASERPWDDLVSTVRTGPPRLSPFNLPKADEVLNTGEYFIHLEDVRRAEPDWQPRELPLRFRNSLWSIVSKRAKMLLRKVPTGVVLERTDVDPPTQVTAKDGTPSVTISGPAAELLLFAFGRREHALVEISGDPDAIRVLNNADLSV